MDDVAVGVNCRVMQEDRLEAAASLSNRFTNNKQQQRNNRMRKQNTRNNNQNRRVRRVSAPVSRGMVGGNNQAQFSSLPNGSIRVRHREFITNIDTSQNSTAMLALPLNPGDSTTFPWLSLMAANYDRWEPVRIALSYEPFTATTTAGSVSAFIDYDPNDEAPVNKAALLNSMGAKRSPIWSNFNVPMARSEITKDKHLFTRIASRGAYTGNLRLSDAGTAFVAVTDSDYVGDVGEMWIDYEILLHVPALSKSDPMASRRLTQDADSRHPLGTTDTTTSDAGSAVDYETFAASNDPDDEDGSVIKFKQDFVGQVRINLLDKILDRPPDLAFFTDQTGETNQPPLLGNIESVDDSTSQVKQWIVNVVAKAGDAFRAAPVDPDDAWNAGTAIVTMLPYAKALMGVLLAASTQQEKFISAFKTSQRPGAQRLDKKTLLQVAVTLSSIGPGAYSPLSIVDAFTNSPLAGRLNIVDYNIPVLAAICLKINPSV